MVIISAAKAKRIGVKEKERKDLSKSQLTSAEKKSGQYKVVSGKTFKTDEAGKTATERLREEQAAPKPTTREPIVLDKPGVETPAGAKSSDVIQLGKPEEAKFGLTTFRKNIGLALTGTLLPDTRAGTVPIGGPSTLIRGKTGEIVKSATNGKTIAQTTSWVSKMTTAMKNPKIIAGAVVGLITAGLTASIGGKVFGKFLGMEEATQAVSIAGFVAMQNKNWEAYNIYKEERDDALRDPTFWAAVQEWIPFKNVLDGLMKFREKATAGGIIMDKVAEDLQIQEETGESDDDKWTRIREEEAESERENIDYYNQERKKMVEWERDAEIAGRNADAAFWRKERAKQRKMEAEDRQAIADFWLAYRKAAQKLADNSRPSNLNFGLL